MFENNQNTFEAAALHYALVNRFRVFPIRERGKAPLTKNGCLDATTDEAQIQAWWAEFPNANVGIATGKESNLAVVDVDAHKGAKIGDLIFGNISEESFHTVKVQTGGVSDLGRGFQFFYKFPENFDLRNSASKLGEFIDTRGEGGYVVALPSIHETGLHYELVSDNGAELLPFPKDWIEKLRSAKSVQSPNGNGHSDLYIAPPYEVQKLPERIAHGTQHDTLFRLGCSLRSKGLSFEAIDAALQTVNRQNCERPGTPEEIRKLVHSIATQYPAGNSADWKLTISNTLAVTEKPNAAEIQFDAAPIPLPERSKVAPPLDERLLPESWREWLADIADRQQCPLEFPTVAAMVAASALIGNKIRIRPKRMDIWQVTPNLWGAVVGVPSMMKSPAVKEGMFFFKEIENEQRATYEREMKDANFEKEFAEAKQAELKKKMRDKKFDKDDLRMQYDSLQVEEPKERRLSTSDATVEKLSELLNENENGILQIRDELTGWFRNLERAGREGDRAFYLECWDGGESTKVDRIARGSLTVKNLTLSILGTIQPAMLEPYLRGALEGTGDDGLIQRFQMLVYPNKPINYHFTDRVPKGREQARKTFRGLFDLEPSAVGAKQLSEEFGGGYFVQFDADAQIFFQDWLTELETDLRSDTFETSAFESHIAKYRSLMPSLALIFHLLDCVTGDQKNDVSLENAQKAAAWCSFLQAHAERIYQIAELSEFDVAREILKKINSKALTNEFTARDIYGKHWAKLNKPQDVRNGLETLTEYGYLRAITIKDAHRPKTVYFIHPELI